VSALLIPPAEWWLKVTLAHGLAAPRSVEMDWPARVCAWPEEPPGAEEIAEMEICSWPKLHSLVTAHRRQGSAIKNKARMVAPRLLGSFCSSEVVRRQQRGPDDFELRRV
jgi:hypothetical protein